MLETVNWFNFMHLQWRKTTYWICLRQYLRHFCHCWCCLNNRI